VIDSSMHLAGLMQLVHEVGVESPKKLKNQELNPLDSIMEEE